jgi:hypothetical protein
MDERMRFVIRLKDGEAMASLCREFGSSGKTGYKIFERYEQCGLEGYALFSQRHGPRDNRHEPLHRHENSTSRNLSLPSQSYAARARQPCKEICRRCSHLMLRCTVRVRDALPRC